MKDFKKELAEVLDKVTTSGTYFSIGVNDFCFPKMNVKNLDEIAFPLNKLQIQALISVAHKAPFGKGSETILDANIRNCWEIDASQIAFEGISWSHLIDKTITQIKPDLGIENKQIAAHLYKMLIYEAGDFFLPHKDSEKEKGMFGTLIIGLPSKHSGGEVILSFDGKEHSVSFAEDCSNDKLPYVAFYADCQHEIKPTTSGYRVCLVYNLIDLQVDSNIKLTSLLPEIDTIENLFQNQKSNTDKPYVYLLGHQYTPTNFSLEQLKLKDRPVAEILLKAAEKAGYYAKLALVTSYQAGELEVEYSGRGRRGYYYDDYDDDIDADSAEMGEIYEEYISIEHWDSSMLPSIDVNNVEIEDLICNFEINDGDPIEKEAEGYTGNAGMEMMFWYHYGAVVFWKKENHLAILKEATLFTKIKWLEYYASRWNWITDFEKKIGKEILQYNLKETYNSSEKETDFFDAIVDFLKVVNDVNFINKNTQNVLINFFSNISIDKWIELLSHFSSEPFEELVLDDAIMKNRKNLNHLLIILNATKFFKLSEKVLTKLPSALTGFNFLEQKDAILKSLIPNLIKIAESKENDVAWLSLIAQCITKRLDRNYVNDYLIANILENNLKFAVLGSAILTIAKKHLEDRVANKPQVPEDWSRAVPNSRSYSSVWAILKDFLQSPTEQVFEFKSLQANRNEMESAIRNVTIDLDLETIRKGSPHTLRLTKNTNAYKAELKKWEQDCVLLRKLE